MNKLPETDNILCKEVFDKMREKLKFLADKFKINNINDDFFKEIVIPLSVHFDSLKKDNSPFLIGLTGGQGSGKTTLSEFVQLILKEYFNRKSIGFSIDDIYKTKEERKDLGVSIHPLCEVRGVPGTHNVQLGLDTLNSLYNADPNQITLIPIFSKPLDEHLPKEDWIKYSGKPDFIFFDGWFCGAKPISEENWEEPINELEKNEDPNGLWSKWYNKELKGDYQKLFDAFDILVMIKVPNMEHVYESRWVQEKTLAKTLKDEEMKKKIMTKDEVYRFVMHYERLTRYILEEVPKFADIVIARDKSFNFKKI